MTPKKQRRGEATASKLLDAALAAHAEGGEAGLLVHAVAERSGVSLGSLYHHFGSATGLSAALYSRCMGELLDRIVRELGATKTARTGIAAVVRGYLRWTGENVDAARFIHTAGHTAFMAAHASAIAAEKAPRVAAIQAFLKPHIEAGRVVVLPETFYEMLVIGPVAEVARRFLAGAPGIDLVEAEKHLPERIWCALRRDDAGRAAARRK